MRILFSHDVVLFIHCPDINKKIEIFKIIKMNFFKRTCQKRTAFENTVRSHVNRSFYLCAIFILHSNLTPHEKGVCVFLKMPALLLYDLLFDSFLFAPNFLHINNQLIHFYVVHDKLFLS